MAVPSSPEVLICWVTDGTLAGTVMVKDILTGSLASPNPGNFTNIGSKVIFSAVDATHGRELWVTDGTSAGTTLLVDIYPGRLDGGIATSFFSVGTVAVFGVYNSLVNTRGLWATDGTAAGTSLLVNIPKSSPSYITPFGAKLLFRAWDGVVGHFGDLWITDGTAAGTTQLLPSAGHIPQSVKPNITDLGASGRAVFSANDGTNGNELWATDGTAAGTIMVANIATASYASSNPGPIALLGTTGRGVFAAAPTASGTQLWVTDGTAAGTSALKTFSGGYNSGSTAFLGAGAGNSPVTLGNQALFIGKDAGVTALWVTDGTTVGTTILSTAVTSIGPRDAGATSFTGLGSKELFWSGTGIGSSPWITDGTAAGTFQLSTTATRGAYGFTVVGNRAVFDAYSGAYKELWVTDGTRAGTYLLDKINPTGASAPANFTAMGGKVFFSADEGTSAGKHGRELWATNGFSFGTAMVKDINPAYYTQSSNPTAFAGVVLPCFAAGTRIATPAGDVRVEALRPGDQLVTASGQPRAIRWIGHRAVAIARHPKPDDIQPIRIAPHAFAASQPHSALYLSPDHAVYADGVLVPIRYLVNGSTITREDVARVTYYHVELADAAGAALHDVILAEGLTCESFLDTGNRSSFSNTGAATALHPQFARDIWAAQACAQLVVEGAEVVALRSWLLERAEQLGHQRSRDPALYFSIDGAPLSSTYDAGWHHLALPPTAQRLRIHSRAEIPAEVSEDCTDTRRLGVALAALVLDTIAADIGDGRLSGGWYPTEPDLRWTDGCATIDVRGVRQASLFLFGAPAYWVEAAADTHAICA